MLPGTAGAGGPEWLQQGVTHQALQQPMPVPLYHPKEYGSGHEDEDQQVGSNRKHWPSFPTGIMSLHQPMPVPLYHPKEYGIKSAEISNRKHWPSL